MSLNPPTTRAVSMDFMRGVAILLILPVNILGFTVGGYAAFWPNFPYDAGFLHHAAFFITSFFVQGKVYPLLALMFGSGAFFALRKLSGQGRSVLPWVYRLLLLFLLGVLHSVLLFEGDILVDYAVAGLVILAVWKLPLRINLWIAALFLLIPLLTNLVRAQMYIDDFQMDYVEYDDHDGMWYDEDYVHSMKWMEDEEEDSHLGESQAEMGRLDLWVQGAHARIAYRLSDVSYFFISFFWQLAGWMIVGYVLAARGVWSGDFRLSERIHRLVPRLLFAALPLQLFITLDRMGRVEMNYSFYLIVEQVGMILMILCYLCLFFMIFPMLARLGFLVQSIANAGRTTLSIYIMYSVVLVVLFRDYAFDLSAGYAVSIFILVPVFWVVFLLASELWLRCFRHGPLEGMLVRLGAKGRWMRPDDRELPEP